MWFAPGALLYIPLSLTDANPDRSMLFTSYAIGCSGFTCGALGLLLRLYVYEDVRFEVLGFDVSLANRAFSAHVSFIVFAAQMAWSTYFSPAHLVTRPDLKYMLVPRQEAAFLISLSATIKRPLRRPTLLRHAVAPQSPVLEVHVC